MSGAAKKSVKLLFSGEKHSQADTMTLLRRAAGLSSTKLNRTRRAGDDDNDDDVADEEIANIINPSSFSNVTLYAGDYHGNVIGLRVTPPTKHSAGHDDLDDGSDPDASNDEDSGNDNKDDALVARRAASKGASAQQSALARFAQRKATEAAAANAASGSPDSASAAAVPTPAVVMSLRAAAAGDIHVGTVKTLSSGGKWLASGGADESIRICKRTLGAARFVQFGALHRHACAITATAFAQNDHLLLTGGEDGKIAVWAVGKWGCLAVLTGHKRDVTSIVAHPTAPVVLSVGRDNTVRMWDVRPYSIRAIIATNLPLVKPRYGSLPLPPLQIVFSTDGALYAVAYARCVYVFHTAGAYAGQQLRCIDSGDIKVLTIAFLDSARIVIGGEEGAVSIVDAVTGEFLAENRKLQHSARIRLVDVANAESVAWFNKFYPIPAASKGRKDAQGRLTTSCDTHAYFATACTEGKIALWRATITHAALPRQRLPLPPTAAVKKARRRKEFRTSGNNNNWGQTARDYGSDVEENESDDNLYEDVTDDDEGEDDGKEKKADSGIAAAARKAANEDTYEATVDAATVTLTLLASKNNETRLTSLCFGNEFSSEHVTPLPSYPVDPATGVYKNPYALMPTLDAKFGSGDVAEDEDDGHGLKGGFKKKPRRGDDDNDENGDGDGGRGGGRGGRGGFGRGGRGGRGGFGRGGRGSSRGDSDSRSDSSAGAGAGSSEDRGRKRSFKDANGGGSGDRDGGGSGGRGGFQAKRGRGGSSSGGFGGGRGGGSGGRGGGSGGRGGGGFSRGGSSRGGSSRGGGGFSRGGGGNSRGGGFGGGRGGGRGGSSRGGGGGSGRSGNSARFAANNSGRIGGVAKKR